MKILIWTAEKLFFLTSFSKAVLIEEYDVKNADGMTNVVDLDQTAPREEPCLSKT